ncbi:replicative DNA helicase [Chitinasiproducens palmae]|uniref:Replicative DNA helicase n=1 Tax=Chitinasiproducens palmae TaxID=1770053 RepID=A0A1H2PPT2_9BURK|nr:replicative DNA helicase [Chitinasiproducens palmae]SDV48691.1 replicative DNA helicase [Chitinasiproducens palmae]
MAQKGPTEARLLTQAIELEQSLLGALLIDNEAYADVAELVRESDFATADTKRVFAAISHLIDNGIIADPVTVSDYIASRGDVVEQCLAYVNSLVQATGSAAAATRYAEGVRNRSLLREASRLCRASADAAMNPAGRTANDVIDSILASVSELADKACPATSKDSAFNAVMCRVVEHVDAAAQRENKNEPLGTSTGYCDLDRKLDGLHGGELVIVAGRPSMGKTSFAMNVAEFIAIERRKNVAIFSIEMPAEQLATRTLASYSRVPLQRLRTGARDDDWPHITHAVQRVNGAPLHIFDEPGVTPSKVRARVRKLQRDHGKLGLIVIDYLQIMDPDKPHDIRAIEISEMSKALKRIARDFDVPVIALSQLNRDLEKRPNKRPVMADIRESGAIEQDADVILFVYRDEVYNPDSQDAGTAEIIIGKQRNGPIGTVRLAFNGPLTKFENFTDPSVH